jgi:hypothetical protein
MHHRTPWLAGLVFSLLMHASVSWAQSKNLAPGFTSLPAQAKVVVMPVDVELFSINAGGVQEPRADWTERAHKHLQQELMNQRNRLSLQVSALSADLHDPMAELNGLHGAIAQSIFLHHIRGVSKLPTKNGELRWSLGEAVKELRDQTEADYALFVWVRDSYASAERKAAMVAMALLGVGIAGGSQVGYASLINLKDGQVVWFNALMRATGDLREAKDAAETVETLLKGFPRTP